MFVLYSCVGGDVFGGLCCWSRVCSHALNVKFVYTCLF